MEIYLIRHGHCHTAGPDNYDNDKHTANPVLTETGRKQALELARKLNGVGFDKIYCSDLQRAKETAGLINNVLSCGVNEDQRFREINMGEIHLSSWSAFPELFCEWSKHERDLCYPGGENGRMVWDRCKPAIEEILKLNAERVIIVTHGGTIRSIICGILGLPQEKRFYLGLPPENCGVSTIRYNDADCKLYLHTFNVLL